MGTKKEGNEAVKDEANPEIDKQAEIGQQTKTAVLGSRRQVGHKEKVDRVTQHDCSQGD